MNAMVIPNSMTNPSSVVNFDRFMARVSIVNSFNEASTIPNRIDVIDGGTS